MPRRGGRGQRADEGPRPISIILKFRVPDVLALHHSPLSEGPKSDSKQRFDDHLSEPMAAFAVFPEFLLNRIRDSRRGAAMKVDVLPCAVRFFARFAFLRWPGRPGCCSRPTLARVERRRSRPRRDRASAPAVRRESRYAPRPRRPSQNRSGEKSWPPTRWPRASGSKQVMSAAQEPFIGPPIAARDRLEKLFS